MFLGFKKPSLVEGVCELNYLILHHPSTLSHPSCQNKNGIIFFRIIRSSWGYGFYMLFHKMDWQLY
jgi:hypothetical protein